MPQLYCQLASRPSPWLLGRTSAGLCTLQTACPLVVTYSGGAPAADTIAAGSAATVYGGSAVAFDASGDVWVVLTVPGSGALQVVKEADLATVTGDWAGLARIVQHAVEPYQPQAYLGAGSSSGPLTPGGVPVASTPGSERLYNLGNSSAYLSQPSGWQDVGFDDSAWLLSVDDSSSESGGGGASIAGATWVTYTGGTGSLPGSQEFLLRRAFVLLPGPVLSAQVQIVPDDDLLGVWINGTSLLASAIFHSYTSVITLSIPATALNAGAANVLGLWVRNGRSDMTLAGTMAAQYSLNASGNGTGGVPTPPGTAVEGDVLYYHSGQWTRLPIGTSGQELTVVAGDPAWTDQPADVDTSGTVTSVAFSGPTGTTTGGSPITTSGTISLSWASQSAGTFLGAPSGSSGSPTFRALVGADIPVDASTLVVSSGTIKGNYQAGSGVSISGNTISATGSGGSVTSVALSLPGIFSVAGSPVTTSGTLSASLAAQSPHTFWGGPASGSSAAPTFRALQSSDLPAAAGAGGKIHAHGHFT